MEGAVKALVKSIELGDTSPDTYGTAAYSHLRVGNLMAAELAYNAAVMLEPNNIEWIEGKAQAMISGKRFRKRYRYWRNFEAESTKSGLPNVLGQCLCGD